ncbi:MAG TPA: Na+-dependent transporter, partial [Gammaproteobacteria bacterium]
PLSVARIVAITVLLPLGIGLAVRHFWPAARRVSAPVNRVGMVLLLLAAALIIVRGWSAIGSLVGDGTLPVIAAFTLLGLVVGHVLGGPAEDDRTVLALSTASRHPAVALAVANSAPSGETLAPAAIALALLAGFVVAIPYTAWRKRLRGNAVARAGAR